MLVMWARRALTGCEAHCPAKVPPHHRAGEIARTRRRATGWGPQVFMLQQPGGKARYGVLCEDAREWPFGHAMSCVHGWADDAELER